MRKDLNGLTNNTGCHKALFYELFVCVQVRILQSIFFITSTNECNEEVLFFLEMGDQGTKVMNKSEGLRTSLG